MLKNFINDMQENYHIKAVYLYKDGVALTDALSPADLEKYLKYDSPKYLTAEAGTLAGTQDGSRFILPYKDYLLVLTAQKINAFDDNINELLTSCLSFLRGI